MPIFDTTPSGGSTSGVTSFNNRTGAVMPQAGDYTAAQVGARPDNWMPTAGDGVSVAGEVISAKVSNQADNIIGMVNGGLYVGAPIPTGVLPLVEIRTFPATPSIQVTGTKGASNINGTTDAEGKVSIEVPQLGVWTFSATIGGESVSRSVAVNQSTIYPATLSSINVFGVAWDKTNPSTQLTRLTPESDPNGLVTVAITEEPVPAVGTGAGSSPFDQYMPWSGMYVCNLNAAGEETAKKGELGFSYATADVMVWIPEFYYRVIDAEEVRYFYIADKQLTGFEVHPGSNTYVGRYNTVSGWASRTENLPLTSVDMQSVRTSSREKGENWGSYDFKTLCAIQLLYLVEFADWNSQSAIGAGISNSSIQENGGTDSMNYHTGRQDGTESAVAIQYRWIENAWGNVWEYIDGYNGNNSIAYISITPSHYASDTGANYVNTGIKVPSRGYVSSYGYVSGYSWAFIPDGNGGSEVTYIPDLVWSVAGWSVLGASGDYNYGNQCGIFAFANNTTGQAQPNVGCRLVYYPQEVAI